MELKNAELGSIFVFDDEPANPCLKIDDKKCFDFIKKEISSLEEKGNKEIINLNFIELADLLGEKDIRNVFKLVKKLRMGLIVDRKKLKEVLSDVEDNS